MPTYESVYADEVVSFLLATSMSKLLGEDQSSGAQNYRGAARPAPGNGGKVGAVFERRERTGHARVERTERKRRVLNLEPERRARAQPRIADARWINHDSAQVGESA